MTAVKLNDFDFDLPDALIATRPVSPRSAAQMLYYDRGEISDQHVFDLPDLLNAGDRLVINNTKVIPARLAGVRRRENAAMGGTARVEVTLIKAGDKNRWSALIKPLKKVAIDEKIYFEGDLSARLIDKSEGQAVLEFNQLGQGFEAALEEVGQMPLPPYIARLRDTDAQDKLDYQTIFAAHKGSVAAPTASLHFDDLILKELQARGIEITYVTLHVGAGTFLPVKVENIHEHKMHAEYGEVGPKAVEEITNTLAQGGRVIPVGTTALRLIETAAKQRGVIAEFSGETDIFIYPGYDFKIAKGLMTNFHLPKSTLIMLVSALLGHSETMRLYHHAVKNGYRFFSYGDASLLFPKL